MTVTSANYNSGCLFCPSLGDRGLINHHLTKFIPLLASKLKSIPKALSDDLHPHAIIAAARYGKQRARIADAEWARPNTILIEFGKRAVVPLAGPAAMGRHKARSTIPGEWWGKKVAEAVAQNGTASFNLERFVEDVIEQAHALWYPGEKYVPTGALIPVKPSAYIAARMAAIVMDPEAGEVAGKKRRRARREREQKQKPAKKQREEEGEEKEVREEKGEKEKEKGKEEEVKAQEKVGPGVL